MTHPVASPIRPAHRFRHGLQQAPVRLPFRQKRGQSRDRAWLTPYGLQVFAAALLPVHICIISGIPALLNPTKTQSSDTKVVSRLRHCDLRYNCDFRGSCEFANTGVKANKRQLHKELPSHLRMEADYRSPLFRLAFRFSARHFRPSHAR